MVKLIRHFKLSKAPAIVREEDDAVLHVLAVIIITKITYKILFYESR